jgi:hypothetical protein
MAKKIAETTHRPFEGRPDPGRENIYPWLRLLELEVQPSERPAPRQGRGRPPNPFPRKAIHVTLTDDELGAVDKLAEALGGRIGIHLHRGHVIAFMAFYLKSRLQKGESVDLPPEVHSLSDLAKYLDKTK